MNTHISINLDKRKARKDGSYSVVMILSHFRKTTSISLGFSIHEKYWDSKKQQAKKTYKGTTSVTRFNNHIIHQKAQAMDVIASLDKDGTLEYMSLKEVKERIKGIDSKSISSFFAYGQKLIDEMRASQKYGNARTYDLVLKVLKSHVKGKDLSFKQINHAFLKKWEISHLGRGNTVNSLSVYMRTVRAIYNKAINVGLVEKQAYPFAKYKIKSAPTEKRAISVESLKKIVHLKLEPEHELFHVRNLFVASYLLYGMNYIDMAFLSKSNIIEGRIRYRRKKTAKLYDIKITEQLQEILNYYIEDITSDGFVFPIIKRSNLGDQYKDVEWSRKRFNRDLKKLAELCGIEEKLTSYVARHSFATQAMLNDIPLQAISAMMGHTRLSTTQVYLASLPNNILDDYQDRLKL